MEELLILKEEEELQSYTKNIYSSITSVIESTDSNKATYVKNVDNQNYKIKWKKTLI
jgi:hypothetical protein